MFTKEELRNLFVMLNRVTFQGNEAEAVVQLKQKIQGLLQEKPI